MNNNVIGFIVDDIYTLCLAPSLPTLPFEVFRQLLDSTSITSDEGALLRHLVIEVGAMHLLLNCLAVLTHQSSSSQFSSQQTEVNLFDVSGSLPKVFSI